MKKKIDLIVNSHNSFDIRSLQQHQTYTLINPPQRVRLERRALFLFVRSAINKMT